MDAIVAENISKVFRLHENQASSIKERLIHLGRSHHRDFQALQPMDLTIGTGETLGILGHNGSGKSTLLKCISGIIKPTTGQIRVRGRIASLLELGAGFHPELTGRENVYINAAFLGINRREIARRFDDIVEFAELSEFIDEPVKHYSSGMYVRLGFAVAINVDPDILLVPLLAFDRRGMRLGYGGGYYDRTLERLRGLKPVIAIGLAFRQQEVAEVPSGSHDQPLDWILT
ncbi:MAG: 5-formyltetrahydrofolate cyclo-ligase, partial [Actinomycetota bacterium]